MCYLDAWTVIIYKNNTYICSIKILCPTIVKIDSITQSFCLHHYVQNGLSYLPKETWPTLCLKGCRDKIGIISLGTNKDKLLHRIQNVRTFTNLQYYNSSSIFTLMGDSSVYKVCMLPYTYITLKITKDHFQLTLT